MSCCGLRARLCVCVFLGQKQSGYPRVTKRPQEATTPDQETVLFLQKLNKHDIGVPSWWIFVSGHIHGWVAHM